MVEEASRSWEGKRLGAGFSKHLVSLSDTEALWGGWDICQDLQEVIFPLSGNKHCLIECVHYPSQQHLTVWPSDVSLVNYFDVGDIIFCWGICCVLGTEYSIQGMEKGSVYV